MSGAKAICVIALISSVIDIVKATKHVYDTAEDAEGLPKGFREVAERLNLVVETLRLAKDSADDTTCTVIKPIIETCRVKASGLKELIIFVTISLEDARR